MVTFVRSFVRSFVSVYRISQEVYVYLVLTTTFNQQPTTNNQMAAEVVVTCHTRRVIHSLSIFHNLIFYTDRKQTVRSSGTHNDKDFLKCKTSNECECAHIHHIDQRVTYQYR